MTTPNTGATEWTAAQASPWNAVVAAGRVFDAFCFRTSVKDRDLSEPPVSCSDGDRYLVATLATGAWAEQDGKLAVAVGNNASGGWLFVDVERERAQLWIEDEAVELTYTVGIWTASAATVTTLANLSDVSIAGLTDNQMLKWDASNGLFYNADDAGGSIQSFRGAMAKKSANQTGLNNTGAVVTWDSDVYDTDSIHDTGSNTSRLTVPAGVTKVRVAGAVRLQNVDSPYRVQCLIYKNGSASFDGAVGQVEQAFATGISVQCLTGVIEVTAGDYFEFYMSGGGTLDVIAARSWFAMEIIE